MKQSTNGLKKEILYKRRTDCLRITIFKMDSLFLNLFEYFAIFLLSVAQNNISYINSPFV